MCQSHLRQAPIALALGGACLLGLGIAGCARENGLNLAKDEARAGSEITERANESILRSKQELASAGAKQPVSPWLQEAEPEERPSLASRWKAPFKGVGNLLKRKPEDPGEDPFLADVKDKPLPDKKDALASASRGGDGSKEDAARSKQATPATGEMKLAMADRTVHGGPAAEGPRAKSVMASDARAALDDFLKSQEPVGVTGTHKTGHESDVVTRKPGTSPRTQSASQRREPKVEAASVALDDSASTDDVTRTGVKSGKARPFPPKSGADHAPDDRSSLAVARNSSARQSASNPLAAAPAGVRRNPLLDEADEQKPATAGRTKQATGREIAGLLKKAKAAGELGEFEEALSYADAAQELAEQCSYEFTSREPSPEKLVAWLEARQSESAEPVRPKTERHQIVATRRPARDLAATATGYSKPNADQVFAEELAEADSSLGRPEGEGSDTAFQEWAAGVGKGSPAERPSPSWPVLSPRELAASNEMWQPSRSEFEQSWSNLQTNAEPKVQNKMAGARLASAESNAPAFVATAQAEQSSQTVAAVQSQDPIVQLGEPTDLAPGSNALAARSSHRRGPRLAAPPPLSIEDAADHRGAASTARDWKQSRTIWFGAVGGLCVLVLVAFRRWAYRSPIH